MKRSACSANSPTLLPFDLFSTPCIISNVTTHFQNYIMTVVPCPKSITLGSSQGSSVGSPPYHLPLAMLPQYHEVGPPAEHRAEEMHYGGLLRNITIFH